MNLEAPLWPVEKDDPRTVRDHLNVECARGIIL